MKFLYVSNASWAAFRWGICNILYLVSSNSIPKTELELLIFASSVKCNECGREEEREGGRGKPPLIIVPLRGDK